ncbi:MAG: glycosyltransferase family 2 protein [Actinobacteria bacterium]|nr:glycosyltransferase family 2 protein [Actinomycetota bacterium]
MPEAPLVRAVVVNHNGGHMTRACIDALRTTDWPADRLQIVLVDNASDDGLAEEVERDLPGIRVVRSATNRGFAGGCNLGFQDLGDTAYVALVNNDATVTPGWLQPLVGALESDPATGAACPKILLDGTFQEVSVHVPTVRRAGRDVGIWVSGARVDGRDVWPRTQLVRGWWGIEPAEGTWPPGQWTHSDGTLLAPADSGGMVELRVAAPAPVTASFSTDAGTTAVDVGREPTWVAIAATGTARTIMNNAGSFLTTDGHGADRGYLEPDDGRFDAPEDVFAWCGAAVVLRREYVDDVGPMDERLFLYYEDLEHAWRGAKRWRYRYVPTSVVHHLHAASTGEGSALKMHHEERNRLLVLTRHATPGMAWRAVLRHPLVTASYARRDVFSRLLHGRRPRPVLVWRRLRAYGAFLVRAPGMLRSRRRDRRT